MGCPSPELRAASARVIAASAGRRGRLSQPERIRLAAQILVAYAYAKLALRRAPIAAAVARLRGKAPPPAPPSQQSLAEALRLGRAVTRLLRFFPGDTRCLARSLVLTRLLADRGIEAKLVIGARTQPEFLAHAWVEHAGDPVLDPGEDSFGRLVEL
jgi:hypothetical protein